jgi:hypothetical protein
VVLVLVCGCGVVHVASTRLPLLLTHIYQNYVLEVGAWVYYRMNRDSKRQQGEEGGKGEGVGVTGAGEVSSITQTKEKEGKGCIKKGNVNKVEKEGRGGKEKGEGGEGEETVGEGQQGEAQAQQTHETQVHHKAAQVRIYSIVYIIYIYLGYIMEKGALCPRVPSLVIVLRSV